MSEAEITNLLGRVEKLETYVQEQRQRELESAKWEGAVATQLENINKTLDNLNKAIGGLNTKIEALSSTPGKRYETIISSLISAFVAFFIAKLTKG